MGLITKAERKKGTVYIARWYDDNNRQQCQTFAKESEAKKHIKVMEGNKVTGNYVDPNAGRVLFSSVAEEWLATNPGRKQGTRHGYEGIMNNHVLPYFQNMQVASITKQRLREFIAEREAAGYGPGTIRNIVRNVLKPSLQLALDNGYIKANPAYPLKDLKLPRSAEEEEMLFLSAEQVRALAKEIHPPYGLLVTFDAYTGLRAGEIAALRVKHLDLMKKTVRVAESAEVVRGKGTVYGPTKTYVRRTVPIPSFLTDSLAAYIADRAMEPNAFVFLSPEGKPPHYKNFYGRFFKPAVNRLVDSGIFPEQFRGLRFHDLRHTCAALMIDTPGAEPKSISMRLGHSSIQVTYDRYGHLFPHREKDITAGLEAAYWKAEHGMPTGELELLGCFKGLGPV